MGNFIGPAAGGALYSLGGWHAPFIFAAALLVIDMALRLLVIETSDAAKHGYTPPWAIDRSEERAQEHSHAATLRALRQLMRSARFWTISYVRNHNSVELTVRSPSSPGRSSPRSSTRA